MEEVFSAPVAPARNCDGCNKVIPTPHATCRRCYMRNYMRVYVQTTPRNWRRMYVNSRAQAASRGLEFTLTPEEYKKTARRPCTYCRQYFKQRSGGLDRIDNSKGYSIDNVLPCCGSCNAIRGDHLTVEETKAAMKAVMELRNGQATKK